MLVEQTESETKGSISHSLGNLKTQEFEVERNVDTLLLSIDIGRYFRINEILTEQFYDHTHFNFKPYYYDGIRENYQLDTGSTSISISSLYWGSFSYYLTIYISSLEKLERDLDIEISKEKGEFSRDLKLKIVDQIITEEIELEYMYIKRCDLTLDIKFPNMRGSFNDFCRNLTSTIMNMKLPYLEGDKRSFYNTGYYVSKSGSRRMRFYNKTLRESSNEELSEKEIWNKEIFNDPFDVYYNTYRIEYIFDSKYQIDKYLKSKKLTEVDVQKGFQKIIDICSDGIEKYRELIHQYSYSNTTREGSSMMSKYSYKPIKSQLICDSSWEVEVDMNRIFSVEEPVFSEHSDNYYKKSNVQKYSYVSYILENDLEYYFNLFDKVIQKAKVANKSMKLNKGSLNMVR